jgi:hypothetical protein
MVSPVLIIRNIEHQVTTSPPLGKVHLAINDEGTELFVTFEEVRPAGDYEDAVQWKFTFDGK